MGDLAMIETTCKCGTIQTWKERDIGNKYRCPKCGLVRTVNYPAVLDPGLEIVAPEPWYFHAVEWYGRISTVAGVLGIGLFLYFLGLVLFTHMGNEADNGKTSGMLVELVISLSLCGIGPMMLLILSMARDARRSSGKP